MNCQSCGMPMDKPEDHGGADVSNAFCKYCTDEQGKLLPRDQVKAKMIQFHIQKQGKTQEEAEKLTDQLMGTMPAWKGGEEAAVPTKPTAEPEPVKPEPVLTTEPEPTPESSAPSSAPGPTETPEPTPEPSASEEMPPTESTEEKPTKPSAE